MSKDSKPYFMICMNSDSTVRAVITVIDEPPAQKRLVITGPHGVYDIRLLLDQANELAQKLTA